MNHHNCKISVFGAFLSILALSSCATVPQNFSDQVASSPQLEVAPQMANSAAPPPPAPDSVPQKQPQLIKRAQLTLVVQSLNETLESVTALIQRQQGDILQFSESQPQSGLSRHTANLELRVPQDKLESTLDTLSELGTVENRSITAEDVSDQLVDIQARLRNLRKSEEMVLKIMERSGSVGEVLEVANQLSNIRDSIERLDAQFRNLQNQVAYSTISLNLEAPVSAENQPQFNFGLQVGEAWGEASHAVTTFSFTLLSLALWLLAFTPYFLLVGGGSLWLSTLAKKTVLNPFAQAIVITVGWVRVKSW
ncbi:DUF4349 domain-containing protein [Capilliphycus salinus ALCB114379]|uniref:DUF4349 domain-containing protein n=1 Tax=Capilliphycus salinus TaxID=2768948 RepID=UPI0039A68D05